MVSFAKAIRTALISGVPCSRPYSNITLLQLIRKGHVHTNHGFWIFDDTHVSVNPGNPADTLQKCFAKNKWVLEELEHVDEGETDIMPLDMTCNASLTAGLLRSNWLRARLLNDGYEVDINQTWDLSIVGNVKKRAVAVTQLESIVNQVRVDWFPDKVIGVVTAVYVVTGGLSYKGKVRAIIKGGAESVTQTSNASTKNKAESVAQTCNAGAVERKAQVAQTCATNEAKRQAKVLTDSTNADTTDTSVAPTPGWKFSVIGNSEIVLTERDPVDWIVAIEYLELQAHAFDDDKGRWLELKTGDEVMKLPPF